MDCMLQLTDICIVGSRHWCSGVWYVREAHGSVVPACWTLCSAFISGGVELEEGGGHFGVLFLF